MAYLGKEKEKQKFLFVMEQDIKEKPTYAKELSDKANQAILDIKQALRTGAKEEEFDRLGILLHAFTAFQKIVKKVEKK
jgi:SPX domain protein involved in polyphosphate accumulation